MKFLLRILLNAIAVIILAYILPGAEVNTFFTAVIVALVLSLLNFLVKPILVILTLPITVVTLGLFLLVINALMILLAAHFIDGFQIANVWWAIVFSLLLSFLQSLLHSMLKEDKKK